MQAVPTEQSSTPSNLEVMPRVLVCAKHTMASLTPQQGQTEDKPKRTFLGMRGGGIIRTCHQHPLVRCDR